MLFSLGSSEGEELFRQRDKSVVIRIWRSNSASIEAGRLVRLQRLATLSHVPSGGKHDVVVQGCRTTQRNRNFNTLHTRVVVKLVLVTRQEGVVQVHTDTQVRIQIVVVDQIVAEEVRLLAPKRV